MHKNDMLKIPVEHLDIKGFDARPIIDAYAKMAFQARNLATAADIYNRMLSDHDCTIILTLAGSLFSAGLKHVVVEMIENNMVDAIVSTGAIIVDQDFFEALGFKHYIGSSFVNDMELSQLAIDRIYDTYIDEDQLRVCDMTIAKIADTLAPKPHSSREFIHAMGAFLDGEELKAEKSVVLSAYKKGSRFLCLRFRTVLPGSAWYTISGTGKRNTFPSILFVISANLQRSSLLLKTQALLW